MLKLKKGQKGFTLIELMIVVAIIGILAAVAIPRFAALMRTAQEGACKGNLGAIRTAVSIYYGTYTYFPGIKPSRVTATTLKALLKVGSEGEAGYRPAVMKIIPKCKCGAPKATLAGDNSITGYIAQNPSGFAEGSEIESGSDTAWGLGTTEATEGDVIVMCDETDTKGDRISMW